MLTSFGKKLRTIRIEHDEILKDMAQKLGVTVAYLSAVENGKRDVPDNWIDIIATEYQLSENEKEILQYAAYENKDSLKIGLNDIDIEEKKLALAFARSFKNLTAEDKAKLNEIFRK